MYLASTYLNTQHPLSVPRVSISVRMKLELHAIPEAEVGQYCIVPEPFILIYTVWFNKERDPAILCVAMIDAYVDAWNSFSCLECLPICFY